MRRLILLFAVVLTWTCLGCDSLYLRTQFVPLEETSQRIWVGKEREEKLRAISPVLHQAVEEADRFYTETLLIRDAPEAPTYYFTPSSLTWTLVNVPLLLDPRRSVGGMADWAGRTYAVVGESDFPGGLAVVVIHELCHVYVDSDACPLPLEEGIVIAVSLLTRPASLGLDRTRAAELLRETSGADRLRLAKQLLTGRPRPWGGKESRQLTAAGFALVDLVHRKGGLVSVGLMLERLHTGNTSAFKAASLALAVPPRESQRPETSLYHEWRSFLREEYLDPCDPELWSPLGMTPRRSDKERERARRKRDEALAVRFRDVGSQALVELLKLAAEKQLVASEQECRQLMQAAPVNPAAYFLAAKVHYDSDRPERAEEAWRTGWRLEGSPEDRAGHFLTRRFYQAEADRAARTHAPDLKEQVLKRCRELAPLWCLTADCPALSEALATRDEARQRPESFEARLRAAAIGGDGRAAEELAEEAMHRFPDKERFRYYLAWLRYRRDDVPGARKILSDDGHWPEDGPWSELRGKLLARLARPPERVGGSSDPSAR